MKYYHDFERTGTSLTGSVGDREAAFVALGMITYNFSELDLKVTNAIIKLLGVDEEVGAIVTCEQSFKVKLHVLTSLVRHLSNRWNFNSAM